MELQVRQGNRRIRKPEGAGLEEAGGRRATLEENVLHTCPSCLVQLGKGIIAVRAGAFADHEQVEMVMQILTDPRQIVNRIDAQPYDRRPRPKWPRFDRWEVL